MYQHGPVSGITLAVLLGLSLCGTIGTMLLAYRKYYLVLMARVDRRFRRAYPLWPVRHAQGLLLTAWIMAQVTVSLGSNLMTAIHWYHPFTGKTLLLVFAMVTGAIGLRGFIMSIVAYRTARVRLASEARSVIELELTNQALSMGASLFFTAMAILTDASIIFLP